MDEAPAPKPPIHYWFIVTGTPRGGAPESVRRQWDGVALPVREPRPVEGPTPFRGREIGRPMVRNQIDDGVPVEADDAVRALELFDRPMAAEWWQRFFEARGLPTRLVFRSYEGRLVPPTYARAILPELAFFDEL